MAKGATLSTTRGTPLPAARRPRGSYDRDPTTINLPRPLMATLRRWAVGRNISWVLTEILTEYFAWHGTDAYTTWRAARAEAGTGAAATD